MGGARQINGTAMKPALRALTLALSIASGSAAFAQQVLPFETKIVHALALGGECMSARMRIVLPESGTPEDREATAVFILGKLREFKRASDIEIDLRRKDLQDRPTVESGLAYIMGAIAIPGCATADAMTTFRVAENTLTDRDLEIRKIYSDLYTVDQGTAESEIRRRHGLPKGWHAPRVDYRPGSPERPVTGSSRAEHDASILIERLRSATERARRQSKN